MLQIKITLNLVQSIILFLLSRPTGPNLSPCGGDRKLCVVCATGCSFFEGLLALASLSEKGDYGIFFSFFQLFSANFKCFLLFLDL